MVIASGTAIALAAPLIANNIAADDELIFSFAFLKINGKGTPIQNASGARLMIVKMTFAGTGRETNWLSSLNKKIFCNKRNAIIKKRE